MTRQDRRSILFLCTANCCRSQMAEAILKHLDSERFEALSAGASPAGYIHPLVPAALEPMGISVIDQHSKSWEDFKDHPPDLLVTVCDSAASEVCPVWPGRPATVHWPLPDPVGTVGSDDEALVAARRVAERIELKIKSMIALDWDRLTSENLQQQLEDIAQL